LEAVETAEDAQAKVDRAGSRWTSLTRSLAQIPDVISQVGLGQFLDGTGRLPQPLPGAQERVGIGAKGSLGKTSQHHGVQELAHRTDLAAGAVEQAVAGDAGQRGTEGDAKEIHGGPSSTLSRGFR